MRLRLLVLFAVLLVGIAFPVIAVAGTYTLHPAGFGPNSYAAWKAQEGLDDPGTGLPQQALYFQKFTDTTTNAAGVAVFKGFAGITVSDIDSLQWKHRDDGWCGAGAPRWNIVSQDTSGTKYIIFVGCAAQAHSPGGASINKSGPHTWTTDTQPTPGVLECRLLGAPYTYFAPGYCAGFTLTQLAIVFDEGTTLYGAPLGPGYTFLDDITVTTNGTSHVWHSASDNGNNSATIPTFGSTVAYADELVPTSEILADLQVLFPGVSLLEFVLYPDVLL